MYEYKTCGLDGIFLVNGYVKHEYGDETFVAIEDMDGLHKLLSSQLIHKPAPLTGAEFRFLRNELDLSQKQLSRLLGNEDQTIAKWEKGQTKGGVPQWADAIIRDMATETILEGNAELTRILNMLSDADNFIHDLKLCLEHNHNWQIADDSPEPLCA